MTSKFHIGETVNFYPSAADLESDAAIEEHLVKGFVPSAPALKQDSKIMAIGPCFATTLSSHLLQQGYQVINRRDRMSYLGRFPDKIGNTFAIRGQLEWAWLGAAPEVDLWHGYEAESLPRDEAVRLRTKRHLDSVDAFVFTLGNAEIWQDEPTGGVFWGAVPADQFDPARHKFRVSSYQDNLVNLMECYRLIRKMRPEATIVMTLAVPPAPATFRPVACLAASTSAKSMLRSAIDEFHRVVQPRDPNFWYFPSYDIARHAFDRPLTPDARRLQPHVGDFLALLFEHFFGVPRVSRDDLLKAFRSARAEDARQGAAVRGTPLAGMAGGRRLGEPPRRPAQAAGPREA